MEDFSFRDKRLLGFTYVMSNKLGLVKVGKSSNPEDRRKRLESASGLPVKIEKVVRGNFKEELTLSLLKKYNTVGEWFECPPEKAVEVLEELEHLSDDILYAKMLNYTKTELEQVMYDRLQELLAKVGGPSYLARMLNVPVTTAHNWNRRGKISRKGAILVDKHKDLCKSFPSNYLRPDL